MKKFISILMATVICLSFAACGNDASGSGQSSEAEQPAQQDQEQGEESEGVNEAAEGDIDIQAPASPFKYSMASGSVGGNFYLMGGGVAQVINNYLPDYFMFTSETTGGSTANLTMLQSGDAELGIAMTSSMYEASQGEGDWTNGQPLDKLRCGLALYPSWVTIYTLSSSGITSMEDLNGKIVGLGSKGMAMDSIFRQYFEENGIEPKQIHNDGHAATATALGNGVIDCAILFSYPPFAAISELESTKDLSFIGLTDDEISWFSEKYNFYTPDEMPGGSYKGAPDPIKGVSEWNMLISSSEVPEDHVYLMVKALCENQEDMIAVHSSAAYMTAENTLNSNIPLHAGTVRYLKEQGVDIPDELIPPEYQD